MVTLVNPARERMKKNEAALGAGIRHSRHAEIAGAMAMAGFDFLFIDLEHSAMSLDVCSQIERGAAVAIVPDEAILNDKERCLARLLERQPPWSDLPLIVLTPPMQTVTAARELESVGHMTLVRRPIEIHSLASTIRAALRDRRRQYLMRADLSERDRQAQVALERLVAKRAVHRDAEQLHAAALELGQRVLVDAQLVGADRAEVRRVDDQQERAPAEVRRRDGLAVLVGQREVRRRGAGLDHRRRPSSWISAR